MATDVFVDASAIIAIMMQEPGFEVLADAFKARQLNKSSPIAVYETVVAIARNKSIPIAEAQLQVGLFLEQASILIEPVTTEIGFSAHEAFARFGKGRHPASLNMGDCFAYACAKRLGVPILYKGDDFALTDIPSALES